MTTERFSLNGAGAFIGKDLGTSDWITMSQARINQGMIVVFFGVFCAAMAYGSWVAGERPSEPPGNQAPGVKQGLG
jgi:hypothetical protein